MGEGNMSIVVEHEKRRLEILEKALDVFVDEGFENTTFQKIADRCGITRTTLYIYFKNKKDIFNYSIKNMLLNVEKDLLRVKRNNSLSNIEKINQIIALILGRMEESRRLLSVSMDYLLFLSRSGSDPDTRIRRRTLRARHILATMIIDGIRDGEIRPVNVRDMDNLLYGLIEAAIFQLVVLKRTSVEELKKAVGLALYQVRAVVNNSIFCDNKVYEQ
jgi:AcrR family transcriptional regulator